MGTQMTFEKWVAKLKCELFEYSTNEIEQLIKDFRNMSSYGAYDEVIELLESEISTRNEVQRNQR